jgi:hypothetical protein
MNDMASSQRTANPADYWEYYQHDVRYLSLRKRAVEQVESRIGEVATRAGVSVDTVRLRTVEALEVCQAHNTYCKQFPAIQRPRVRKEVTSNVSDDRERSSQSHLL